MHIQWTGSLRGLLAALVALFLLGCEEAADARLRRPPPRSA